METDNLFYEVITSILKSCNLTDEVIRRDFIKNVTNFDLIKRCFIDRSYDPIDNNELLAAKGNIFLDYILSRFIDNQFLHISSSFQYTCILNKLRMLENYKKLIFNLQLENFIKHNPINCKDYKRNCPHYDPNQTYECIHIYKQVFSALCYFIIFILKDEHKNNFYDFFYKCILDLNILFDYEHVVSPITRLYEIYGKLGILVQKDKYIFFKERNQASERKYRKFTGKEVKNETKIIGFGYVLINNNRQLICVVASKSKKDAQEKVVKKLLAKYASLNIFIPKPDTWNDNL